MTMSIKLRQYDVFVHLHDALDVQFIFRKSFKFSLVDFKCGHQLCESTYNIYCRPSVGHSVFPVVVESLPGGIVGLGGEGGDGRPGSGSLLGSGDEDESSKPSVKLPSV